MWRSAKILLAILIATTIEGTKAINKSEYENKYKTKLEKKEPDELVQQPLKKLAFGSCQRTYPQLKEIYQAIYQFDPDLFLFLGDNFYTDLNCCTEKCVDEGYKRMVNFPPFKEFKKRIKKFDGVYDDHDYGINDGDKTYKYKDHSLKVILDFFEKPEDHYRRRRKGCYFSLSYVDPENKNNHVKLIMLDTRYHRDCLNLCLCQRCKITCNYARYVLVRRVLSSIFGIGCDHPGDVLGEEQWKWLESQVTDSEARAHVIVSSFQVLTKSPMGESWGHLPQAKRRLLDLLEATQPKKPVILSGDIHYGELIEKYGLVEYTSSSLTHSVRPYHNYAFMFVYPFYLVSTRRVYLYNNFGGIKFKYNEEEDYMEWDGGLYNSKLERKLHYRSGKENLYEKKDEPDSFFRDYRLVKCLTPVQLVCRSVVLFMAVVMPLVVFAAFLRDVMRRKKKKKD